MTVGNIVSLLAGAALMPMWPVLGLGFGVLTLVQPGDGYPKIAIALAVLGCGSGIAGPAAYGTLLGSLPKERAGVGSAVNDTVQQVGQALSVAVLGTLLTSRFGAELPDTVTGNARDSIGDALATAAARQDPGLADTAREAFVHAMTTTSYVGLAAGIGAALIAAAVLPARADKPADRTSTTNA